MQGLRTSSRYSQWLKVGCAVLCLGGLAGCASSLSGITGGAYACKAPIGTGCQSVSTTYQRALDQSLPGQVNAPSINAVGGQGMSLSDAAKLSSASGQKGTQPGSRTAQFTAPDTADSLVEFSSPPSGGFPIRSQPKVMRIWMAPGEDADGIFNDQRYIYLVVEPGKWQPANALRKLQDNGLNRLSRLEQEGVLSGNSLPFESLSVAEPNPLKADVVSAKNSIKADVVEIKVKPVAEPLPQAPTAATGIAGDTGTDLPAPIVATRPRVIIRPLPQDAQLIGGR